MLLIGIGNSGRSDDGLGWMMLDHIKKKSYPLDLLYRYQLQVEDADLISHYQFVIFVDATKEPTENGFYFRPCQPGNEVGLTSHMLHPGTVLWIDNELYNHQPTTFVMGIEGKKWGLSLKPSPSGLTNLKKAKKFLTDHIEKRLQLKKTLGSQRN